VAFENKAIGLPDCVDRPYRDGQAPLGTELRISVDGELYWSRLYRDGHGHQ
jgi:hypothetical protein